MICGHVYDPANGDGEVPAGTAFSDVPEDWTCPICMANKSMFITI
ncbi:MAG TPA: rubredoxin [Methanospirillum sp.]|nr:rubredoxin [Methanospirillum sp.]